MNEKASIVIVAVAIAGLILNVFLQTTETPAPAMSSSEQRILPDHLANQNRAAKLKLFHSASKYINSLNQYMMAVNTYLALDNDKYYEECRRFALLHQDCPRLDEIDYDAYIDNIGRAAAELAQAEVVFECEVRMVAFQACKEVGQLCIVQNEDNIKKIVTSLPLTAYDSQIMDALEKLPHTQEIFLATTRKITANSPSN
ncbi:MAG: hypothetical protein H6969_06760 [Gammaproteobacteria bacterium]|nr:hypothetical protein [Gammaproteobacteria bacterium]